ncbi:MAG: PEP-CTERM sorting domain-containing protein [Planctomycetota bacterium]
MVRVSQLALLTAVLFSGNLFGQVVFGPDTDPNANGVAFDQSDAFNFGVFGLDDTALEQGPMGTVNDIIVYSAAGTGVFNDGAGYTVRISNGENGNDGTGPDPDPMNPEPANPIFGFNSSGRLENGNVIRYSQWMRHDVVNPFLAEPQVEPILKLEFWTEALSGNADFNTQPNPVFGDRIFDTDQNWQGDANGLSATFIDINNDGDSNNPLLNPPDFTLVPGDDWLLVHTMWEVNDTGWGYTDPNNGAGPAAQTVADVEDIRAVTFLGDFAGTAFGDDPSAVWLDNPMVEIYQSMADVPATIPNPRPEFTQPPANCDLNGDTSCDLADIDLLTQATASGSGDLMFDLNGDMLVNQDDINEWLVQAGADPGNAGATDGNPFLNGDANLDGVVDGQDFIEWNNFKFSASDRFSEGDFNGDGVVDGQDFIIWNTSKFTASSGDVASVPEPSAAWLILLGMLGLATRRVA